MTGEEHGGEDDGEEDDDEELGKAGVIVFVGKAVVDKSGEGDEEDDVGGLLGGHL